MTLRFGTDGVRGIANAELTSELSVRFARAAVSVSAHNGGRPRFLVARDTRISGEMIEAAVVAGLCAGGADAILCGIIPTPALSCIVPRSGASGAIMISASHNPYQYNGLKFFNGAGDKLSEAEEAAIESLVYDCPTQLARRETVGRLRRDDGMFDIYVECLLAFARDMSLHGMSIVVDCAHGALSGIAPRVLGELGVVVTPLNCSPTGMNINEGGAVSPQRMAEEVRERSAAVGLAFDGDGDRLVMADENGTLVDGDQILGVWAQDLARRGELTDDVIAGTVLTNSGLEGFLRPFGCRLLRAPVGDRYVAAEMARVGAILGGETCGHIIYAPHLSSSDALLTGIAILDIMARNHEPFSTLAGAIRKRPQVSLNLPIASGDELLRDPEVRIAVSDAEAMLGESGRVIVRPSGTEPVLRVTCECCDEHQARAVVNELAEVIEGCCRHRDVSHADIAA